MLISEMISQLEHMKKNHGDGNIYYVEDYKPRDLSNHYRWIHHVSYEEISGEGCSVILSASMGQK